MILILELMVHGLARWLRIDWLFWNTDGGLAGSVADEQRQRQHNRAWARDFLEEKRVERQQQLARREARASEFVKPAIELGRPGSRRKP